MTPVGKVRRTLSAAFLALFTVSTAHRTAPASAVAADDWTSNLSECVWTNGVTTSCPITMSSPVSSMYISGTNTNTTYEDLSGDKSILARLFDSNRPSIDFRTDAVGGAINSISYRHYHNHSAGNAPNSYNVKIEILDGATNTWSDFGSAFQVENVGTWPIYPGEKTVTAAADITLLPNTDYSLRWQITDNGAGFSNFTVGSFYGITNLVIGFKKNQSITVTQAADAAAGATVSLAASITSGLPVTWASTTAGTCSVSGSTATLLAPGTCTVSATQSGNAVWVAAPQQTMSFNVLPAAATTTTAVPTTTTPTTTTAPITTVVETTTTTVPTTNLPTTTVLAAAGTPKPNVPSAPKTPVATTTTSTTATIGASTTTSTAAPAVIGTSGAPLSPAPVLDPSSSPFGLAPSSDRHFALSTARSPDGAVTLSGVATGLAPGSTLRIVSQPGSVTVGTITVGPDGTANVNIPLDSALVADGMSLEVSGTTSDGEEIGAVGVPTDTSPAGGVAAAVFGEVLGAPPEIQLARSAESGLPVYDTARRVRDTVALTTAAAIVSAIAIGALGSVAGTNGPLSGAADGMRVRQGRRRDDDQGEGDESEASLSATDANLLDSLDSDRVGRGDASLSWRAPGGDRLHGAVSRFVRFTEHRSLLLTRIATDGQWVRAWWGSASVILWVGALLTGVLAALAPGKDLVMLALPWAIALMVIGMLDAAAGLSAFVGLAVPLLVLGRVESLYDVRTLLGIGVMTVALPSIGSAIRPLRRIGDGTRASRLDRVADYLIVPLFLGYAGSSAYASLNGLSGLGMVTSADATVFRNVLFAVALLRLIAEDLTVSEYPQRLRAVHVPVDPDPSVAVRTVSLAGTAATFLLVAGPFFGYGWQTWVALAAVVAVPVLNNISHLLPNFAVVHRWTPRGVLRSVVMCYAGAWFAAALASRATDAFSARSTAVLLLLPGVMLAVVDVFAREGGDWPDNVPKRVAGLGLWFLSALLLVGAIVP